MKPTEPLESGVLEKIREDLRECLGERVRVKANKGRKVIVENMGILEETYPHLFVVRVDSQSSAGQRVSFSYSDIITKTVELTKPDTNETFFPWLNS
ncbi:MAG: Veg family protein [Actinomycetota bacterium]|nr:Veg family protein [Actinomycetota bacterium]